MKRMIGLLLISSPLGAQHLTPTEPLRNYHTGEALPPACSEDELSRLRKKTTSAARHRNATSAWRLVKATLCGERVPLGSMSKLVAQEQYGLGEVPGPAITPVQRENISAFKGQAFGVEVAGTGSDIRLTYNTAGVCVGGFTLRSISSDWLLVNKGEACD